MVARVLFWAVLVTMFACLEIEIEGKYGWADETQTWYRVTGFWGKLYGRAMRGRPLTGYHGFLLLLLTMIIHLHFFMGVKWSIAAEFQVWALFFVWIILFEYVWFLLNPHYRGKFNREHIWWHAKSPWVLSLFPADYLKWLAVSLAFAGAATCFKGSAEPINEHLRLIAGFGLFAIVLQIVAPLYHYWYWYMRKRDDRNLVNRFYP